MILHEIGHGVGLAHFFADTAQIMSYGPSVNVDRFAAGDLAGLQRLGRSAGCFVDETPHHRNTDRSRVMHPEPVPVFAPRS